MRRVRVPWNMFWGMVFVSLVFSVFTLGLNFQPIYVVDNDSFTDVWIKVRNSTNDEIHDEVFLSGSTRTEAVVYINDINSTMNMQYNYSLAVNISGTWEWTENDTLGYFGRGDLWDGNFSFTENVSCNYLFCTVPWAQLTDVPAGLADGDDDTQLSQEQVEDYAGGMVSGNEEIRIDVIYDDNIGKYNFTVDDMNDDDPEPGDVDWTDLTDDGTFTDTKYCTYDSGNSRIDCNSEGGAGVSENLTVGIIVGFTASEYDGNLSGATDIGYVNANAICENEYTGSYFCTVHEVIYTIRQNWSFSGTYWVANGPPGYTANADDCQGWTSDSNTYLGPFWNFDGNAMAGYGRLTNCAQTKKLACCIP